MKTHDVVAEPEYAEAFEAAVVALSPRHAGKVDLSACAWYFDKGWSADRAAALYVHHRPRIAE